MKNNQTLLTLLLCLITLPALARKRLLADSRIFCNFRRGGQPSSRALSKLCMAKDEVAGQSSSFGEEKRKVLDQVMSRLVR